MVNRDMIDFWGVNMRLQPLQAIVALEGLKKLDKTISKRNLNAKRMDKLLLPLFPNVILPKRRKNHKETFALYMILVNRRDQLLKYLHKNGIEAKVHYPIPLNKQKLQKILFLNQKNFSISNYQFKKLITLPIHQYITSRQIVWYGKKNKKFL